MCNELVHELCKEIPTAKTSDRILLTAHNVYAYLAPIFSKKLIYRDAIAFLKANLNAKIFVIQIGEVAQFKECEPIVVINQEESDKNFKLETNHFRVEICNEINVLPTPCAIAIRVGHFENVHLYYFLRLIAQLIQPIQLYVDSSDIPTEWLVRFMNTQSDWIDSIGIWDEQFNLKPIYGALSKYNKLEIHGRISPVNVPKLIHWLTENNKNGQPKKYLFLCNWNNNGLDDGLALLMNELKKEFALATRKSRFVVRLKLSQPLDEFTLCNKLGEKLQLRLKNDEDGWYFHALSRSPDSGLEDNEDDSAELDTFTQIYKR